MKMFLFNIGDVSPSSQFFKDAPLGLGYIKSYFEKYSELRDKIEIKILRKDVWNTIHREKPDVIGISSCTQDYNNAIKYARGLRDGGIQSIILLGGIHISNLPDSLDPVFDIGIIGEGEITVKETLECVYEHGLNKPVLFGIKGLVFYDEKGDIVVTERRPLITNLDDIPFPSREGLGVKTHVQIITSRGCPFKCVYCSSSSFWQGKFRLHSAEYVVAEMIYLLEHHNAVHISIWDDLFAINEKRLEEILKLIKVNEKYFKSVTFGITARTDSINENICKLLKEINVTRVAVGIESGSDRMLRKLKKGRSSIENHQRAVKLLKKYGFFVTGGLILGSPDETLQDMHDTYDFVINSELDGGGSGIAVPYPNTEFWDFAEKKGLVNKHMDFSKLRLLTDFTNLSENDDFILLSENITKSEIIYIGRCIQKEFAFRNAKNLIKQGNIKNISMCIRHPFIFLPFVFNAVKSIIKNYRVKSKHNERL